ncbi:ornithine carbamoyltransferase [Sporosarcina pasteurii]|uniref:Ornithine carbamoyltransferase n=1 Tax=Sporosarcina pasteurii TaxID=1474 RepID=A0A380C4P6_SPOPA|nr:ornithine carbamoyltransferase [Sporosarcina pasteurii]MDS9471693.1 ornithine carbamoyltransferase [Sporosarcina pasteurii]QBQ04706.1 ornithine carbamoyltransferase [Sporosarcina pasteurii]SUJ12079.1 Ornithine carbamoyltransferase [Sporosarcina pasteurii]
MVQLNLLENDIEANLKGRDLLSLLDFTSEEVVFFIQKAVEMKKAKEAGKANLPLSGKTLGMIFEKNSTRTRISFEVGMIHLGGHAIYMNAKDLQLGRGESIHDTAKVLSEFVDGVMIRANSHEEVKELAKYSSIPIINGLTDIYHPCQALADLLTIFEVKGTFAGKKLAYVGDGNNVAHSLVVAAAHVGLDVVVATPKGYECDDAIIQEAKKIAEQNGSLFELTNDPVKAVTDADAIYTDVWTSMGQEEETAKRLKDFNDFQINDALIAHAKSDYMFLHCLPANREEEVATSVIDGPNSYVFHQAGNRLHAQKAVLATLL